MTTTGIDASLARGLVRHEDRVADARFVALLKRGPTCMRFGARARGFVKVLKKAGLPIVLLQEGKTLFQVGVLDGEGDGSLDLVLTRVEKGGEPATMRSALGLTRHCRERILQQAVPMAEAAMLLRWMVLEASARKAVPPAAGWIATARALWRLHDYKLTTVILADRLDGDNATLWQGLREAGDADKAQWRVDGVVEEPWKRIEQIVNYRKVGP
jgi:DNA-directed RNA polymerase subunit N (RpoN/RPB10)